MKVFYHGGNKNPFIFETSTNESGTIIYHLHECQIRLNESIIFGESMLKAGNKDFKKFVAEKKRALKDITKILDDYEKFRQEFTKTKP